MKKYNLLENEAYSLLAFHGLTGNCAQHPGNLITIVLLRGPVVYERIVNEAKGV
jgi:hypothetical protein